MTQRISELFQCGGTLPEHAPMMHVQDQKATGVAGGDSIVGENIRDLNEIVSNEIVGASLEGGEEGIILPAGKYYISVSSPVGVTSNTISYVRSSVTYENGDLLLTGANERVTDGNRTSFATTLVAGEIELAIGSTIRVSTYTSESKTSDGLGGAVSQAPYEVYTDIRIWKIDSIIQSPIIHDSKLYPLAGNTYVTGNMYGLEYSYSSALQISVDAGMCYDDLNTSVLTRSAQTTVDLIEANIASWAVDGSAVLINQVYNIFVIEGGGIKFDTDVDGANITEKKRWIGFVLTDATGSGEIYTFEKLGDTFTFARGGQPAIGTASAAWAMFSTVDFVPSSRIDEIGLGAYSTGETLAELSYDGLNAVAMQYTRTTGRVVFPRVTFKSDIYVRSSIDSGSIVLKSVTLKR